MCAIGGIVRFDSNTVAAQDLQGMSESMAHRGPDGDGRFAFENIGLCHRRLAIIDPLPRSDQPFTSNDQIWTLVYNGEIYNYQSLRDQLESEGLKFHTNSDTEVLLNGFRLRGENFLNAINGMFSFAIFNKQTKTLWTGRDPFGIKPLYYAFERDQFVFASEIKGLLAAGIAPRLNAAGLAAYFENRFSDSSELLFDGINKLSPGHILEIKGRETKLRKWYSTQNLFLPKKESEFHEQLNHALVESVRLRSLSDAPIGSFLSGGIDSGLVTAIMAKNKAIPTFTMRMGQVANESEEAKALANDLGLDHFDCETSPSDFTRIDDCLRHLEEPLGDSIILPTFLLGEAAAQKVKVVQTGEGADEILGGYIHHQMAWMLDRLQNLISMPTMAAILDKTPTAILDGLAPYPQALGQEGRVRLVRALQSKNLNHLRSLFTPEEIESLLSMKYKPHAKKPIIKDLFKSLQEQDLHSWLPDYNLLRIDKLTMAWGLEARVPYLDKHVVDLCMNAPSSWLSSWTQSKKPLRRMESTQRLLPRRLRHKKKTPFFYPMEQHDKQAFLKFVSESIDLKLIKKETMLSADYVEKLIQKGPADFVTAKQLTSIAIFCRWKYLFNL